MEIKIQKIYKNAKMPIRAHETDAGMDLFFCPPPEQNDISISNEQGVVKMPTGIKMEIPEGYVGLIWDKSGLSSKGIKVFGGVIDSSYRGEIIVSVANLGRVPFTFNAGDKIAQMLIQKIETPKLLEVDKLSETDRGEGGFGSTGNK